MFGVLVVCFVSVGFVIALISLFSLVFLEGQEELFLTPLVCLVVSVLPIFSCSEVFRVSVF